MSLPIKWERASQSANNFDMVLVNPEDLDRQRIGNLLEDIQKQRHRGLSLSARADEEFRRWLKHPDTPLGSEAYVLLSNWYLTHSGDRLSDVAVRCEQLWDELFPCRPTRRLSSPAPGRNHLMLPNEFENFWRLVLKAQADDPGGRDASRTTIWGHAHPDLIASHASPSEDSGGANPCRPASQPLTIAEAKAALAETFGISPDNIEITIRG